MLPLHSFLLLKYMLITVSTIRREIGKLLLASGGILPDRINWRLPHKVIMAWSIYFARHASAHPRTDLQDDPPIHPTFFPRENPISHPPLRYKTGHPAYLATLAKLLPEIILHSTSRYSRDDLLMILRGASYSPCLWHFSFDTSRSIERHKTKLGLFIYNSPYPVFTPHAPIIRFHTGSPLSSGLTLMNFWLIAAPWISRLRLWFSEYLLPRQDATRRSILCHLPASFGNYHE
jgi:hypothetical protein